MRRALWIGLTVLLLLPLAALAAAHLLLSGDALRARAVAAVERATGRTLVIAGPIRLGWSLTPTIEADDVSLRNPPGFTRPDFVHVGRLEARIGLPKLLSGVVSIDRLLLAAPDIRFERDAQGRPNWLLTPPPGPAGAPGAPGASGPRFRLAVGDVALRDVRAGWEGHDVTAPTVDYRAATGQLDGRLDVGGTALALSGTAGPFGAGTWPVDVRLAGAGLTARLSGTSQSAGLAVEAADLADASALVGRALPALRQFRLAATLGLGGVDGIEVAAGPSELGGWAVQSLSLEAPHWQGPAALRGTVTIGARPMDILAQVGSLAGLAAGGAVPFTVHAAADEAVLDGQGTLGPAGASLALHGRVLDLATFGAGLPRLTELTGDAALAAGPRSVAITAMKLQSAQGDLAGDLRLTLGARPRLDGTLRSTTLNVDGLLPTPPPATAPSQPGPAAAPPAAPAPARVIPDRALPFAALRTADADLTVSVGDALWQGAHLRGLQAHAVLAGGSLRVDPAQLALGDAPVRLLLEVDAAAPVPTVHVRAEADGAAAGPAGGKLDLRLDLRGAGETIRAQAATLSGRVALAVTDATIEDSWLQSALAGALRTVNLPVELGGSIAVGCFVGRADAASGQVTLRTLALDTSKLRLDASGGADLRTETLDLHLRPVLRVGTALAVPLRVGGSFASPKVSLDPGAFSLGRVGLSIGGAAPAETCRPAIGLVREAAP